MEQVASNMSVDKSRKLRRYTRKDYSQVVDFPVEIVGRDGVIRRYSFEESVRLYQRRIASASIRYGDHEVVDAEVQHCRRRIEQLRRSYFARYGWAAIKVMDSPGVLAGEFAGEVAAFLRRCLDGTELDPEALEFTYLEEGEYRQVYFVQQRIGGLEGMPSDPPTGERYLLYLFRFDQGASERGRDAFFEFLKVLQAARVGGDGVETLVAFHHSADCGLVLSGQRGAVKEFVQHDDREELLGEVDVGFLHGDRSDLLREGMSLLRQGRRAEALGRFIRAYEDNHYRNAAYVGACVVADQLGRFGDAETAALMGSHYFPRDPSLHYHLALARLRQEDNGAARDALDNARGLEGPAYPLQVLDGLIELQAGDVKQGARRLRGALGLVDEQTDADLLRAHRWVLSQLRARRIVQGLGVGAALCGAVFVLLGSLWGLALVAGGATLIPVVHRGWRRQFRAMLATAGSKGLRLASPSMMRTVKDGEPRQ